MKQGIMPIAIAAELLAGVVFAGMLTGCVVQGGAGSTSEGASSNTEQPPASNSESRTYFNQKVYPQLKEACASCHATGANKAPIWFADDANASWDKLKTYSSGRLWQPAGNNPLLLRGTHLGPALSAEATTAVNEWLKIQFPDDSAGGGATPGGGDGTQLGLASDAIKAFSECMSFNDWLTENMDKWSLLQTTDEGSCAGCHEQGNAGTWIQADDELNYKQNRKLPYIYRIVTPVYKSGSFAGLEASTRLTDKATKPCFQQKNNANTVEVCHPTYIVPAILKNSVQNFFSDTNARIKDNKCTEPQP